MFTIFQLLLIIRKYFNKTNHWKSLSLWKYWNIYEQKPLLCVLMGLLVFGILDLKFSSIHASGISSHIYNYWTQCTFHLRRFFHIGNQVTIPQSISYSSLLFIKEIFLRLFILMNSHIFKVFPNDSIWIEFLYFCLKKSC